MSRIVLVGADTLIGEEIGKNIDNISALYSSPGNTETILAEAGEGAALIQPLSLIEGESCDLLIDASSESILKTKLKKRNFKTYLYAGPGPVPEGTIGTTGREDKNRAALYHLFHPALILMEEMLFISGGQQPETLSVACYTGASFYGREERDDLCRESSDILEFGLEGSDHRAFNIKKKRGGRDFEEDVKTLYPGMANLLCWEMEAPFFHGMVLNLGAIWKRREDALSASGRMKGLAKIARREDNLFISVRNEEILISDFTQRGKGIKVTIFADEILNVIVPKVADFVKNY